MKAAVGVAAAAALTGGLLAVGEDGELVIQDPFKSNLLNRFTKHTGIGLETDYLSVNLRTGLISLRNSTISYPPNYDLQSTPTQSQSDFSFYNLKIESVQLKPSLVHFLLGNGWIRQINVNRIRGDVDKRFIQVNKDPFYIWKYNPKQNDFHIDQGVHLTDLSVQLHYPESDGPYSLFLEKGFCPLLRKRWLLYDLIGTGTKLTGTFEHNSPIHMENGILSIGTLPLRYLRSVSLQVEDNDSSTDPLSHLIDSNVDLSCKMTDNFDRSKKFHIDLTFSNNHFHSNLNLFSISIPSFTRFLNETRPSFKIHSQFDIPLNNFYCVWNLRDAGIQRELMHHSFRYFNSYITNRSIQLEWLAKYSYWSVGNVFSFVKNRNFVQ